MMMGATGKKFVAHLRATQNQPQPPSVDIGKVIDEKLAQERQRNEEQAKAEAFGKAISEQAPTLQGLLDNSAFVEFINNKVIDFAGNTAAALLNFAGNNKRLDLVPKIAELVTEFEQSRQPPAQQVTAPPNQSECCNQGAENRQKAKTHPWNSQQNATPNAIRTNGRATRITGEVWFRLKGNIMATAIR